MGLNSSGQLGQGNTIDTTTPVQITDKDNFLEVDAGDGFVAAIAEDGIYTFGANENGQLGIGSTENALTPQRLSVEFEIPYEKFVDVSASTNYCLALTNKGNVYAWGRNGSGQLGIGNKTNQTTPQKVSALSDIVYINAENVQSFAIKKDGTVYGWGHGSNYQLASTSTGTCQSPREITSLKDKDIKRVVCGDGYGIAVSRNGNMYTFGSNENGALAIYTEEAQEYISDKMNDLHWLRNYMGSIGNSITEDITLPETAPSGAAIKWTSSHPGYISETGEVNRPDAYGKDTEVRLRAELGDKWQDGKAVFDITVLQDPNKKPSTDIPIRMLGDENDQTTQINNNVTPPNIKDVSYKKVEGVDGTYILTVNSEYDENANPFYFWKSRQGTFLPVDGYDNYKKVQFIIDSDCIEQSVKVTVGIGDGLGYVDKASFYIGKDSGTHNIQSSQQVSNIVAMAMDEELNMTDVNNYNINLAIGVDTSENMYRFDPNETGEWMNSVKGLINSVPSDTQIALICDQNTEYFDNIGEAEKSLNISDGYTGDTNALRLLEKCEEALNDESNISQNGNKIVVLFAESLGEQTELKQKINKMQNDGIAVYIMLMTDEMYSVSSENIIVCENELKLRLNISELYGAFKEIEQAETVSTYGIFNNTSYTSEYIPSVYSISDSSSFGSNIASVLNLYGCLPLIAERDSHTKYNLFTTANVTNDDIYNLINRNYSEWSSTTAIDTVCDFYNNLKNDYINNSHIAVNKSDGSITEVIDNNLKYRFPVIAVQDNNSCIITGKNGSEYITVGDAISFEDDYKIIDTYWLRTQYTGTKAVSCGSGGITTATKDGKYGLAGVDEIELGVRPAFYLNEENMIIKSGSGTKEDPYIIDGKEQVDVPVFCNGKQIEFDVQPVEENDRLLVPVRAIFEELGAEVTYDDGDGVITANNGERTVVMQIDNPEMGNGTEVFTLDVAPKLVNDRTLVPLRAVAEAFDCKVEWIEGLNRAVIDPPQPEDTDEGHWQSNWDIAINGKGKK